ncbi:MAG TPA: bifunctional 3,4-dihydroxy-2-butanone-4-phosphate synthase/GTP cyclohydrolase II, partial [Baekduia sp.]|nr:bifunctional 3,4-dihydroxy-2-butanone-4-phosphate synthase/GTP cyclohydrolase II [Baekduia sp.]
AMSTVMGLCEVDVAVAAIARGEMVVVVDSASRENEGDLVLAADHVTPEAINFMATHARGLICAPMTRERLDALGIPPMVARNTDRHGTAFHVGVDARVTTTGISAADRAATIAALADPAAVAVDFTRPGHVFPLAYAPGGVLERAGHTEASVDLARLAGASPAAVICEIAGPDGEMMRLPALLAFAAEHGLLVVAITDLIEHRRRRDPRVVREADARIPVQGAEFAMIGYRDRHDDREHVAMVLGDVAGAPGVLVRLHSECLTGDVFHSLRCDCGGQLEAALAMIARAGAGVVVYLRGHEGRGIGLIDKLRAYELQDGGLDTVEANLALGHPADARDYGAGADILRDLGVDAVRLITNNPAKRDALVARGLTVIERVPAETPPTAENVAYLSAKRRKMGHLFEVAAPLGATAG